MDERAKMLKDWNAMINCFRSAERAWQRWVVNLDQANKCDLSMIVTRAMTSYARARTFGLMLPDLVRYWRTRGGLDALLVEEEKIKEFETKKEKENGT